ncbi:MAG: GGDEF domain-containing protein [Spirochaetales bacterium]|nr:GGDEF domain-containing protein [Spirochaetales bacterium]
MIAPNGVPSLRLLAKPEDVPRLIETLRAAGLEPEPDPDAPEPVADPAGAGETRAPAPAGAVPPRGALGVVLASAFASSSELVERLRVSGLDGALVVVPDTAAESELLERLALHRASVVVDTCREADLAAQGPSRLALLARRRHGPESRDPLTGLRSRTAMRGDIEAWFAMNPREGAAAVWMLDLDRFKRINDTFGHVAGDETLRVVAGVISGFVELAEGASRIGGEEFGGLVRAPSREVVVSLLAELGRQIREASIRHGDAAIHVTASVGFAFLSQGMTVEDAYRRADMALYMAKSRGRDRQVCDDLAWDAAESDPTRVALEHFENVTKVWTDRMSELIRSVGRRAMEETRKSAERDGLTGLYNRGYWDRRIARELANAAKSGQPLSVAMFDIDDFHWVNVDFGYPTGDLALKAVAELAQNHSRLTDWVARYGGEEFMIVMPGTPARDAALVAERFRAALEAAEVQKFGGGVMKLTASVGVASIEDLEPGALDPVSLVQAASDRVMAAKAGGKNRVSSAFGTSTGASIVKKPERPGKKRA